MEWHDQGIVLSSRKHGESSAIVTLLTHDQGRHLGLVRGGMGKRAQGLYQPGNLLAARWRARISEHLGSFTCEMIRPCAAHLLSDPLKLACLSSACSIADVTLPERVPETGLFEELSELLNSLESDDWQAKYVHWEISLLRELGFGLDLSRCASTGQNHDLIYVSPRTGRAVSREAGEPYKKDLLPLPSFLTENASDTIGWVEIDKGLRLTRHFIEHHVLAPHQRKIPAARNRLVERIQSLLD